MPTVFLSPSTQEYNAYYDGAGSEEYYMNRLQDAMVPDLERPALRFSATAPATPP